MVPNFRITFTSVPVLVKWFVVSSHLKELQLTYTILIEHTFHHIYLHSTMNFWAALGIIGSLLKKSFEASYMDLILFTNWSAYNAKNLLMVIWTLPNLKSRKILFFTVPPFPWIGHFPWCWSLENHVTLYFLSILEIKSNTKRKLSCVSHSLL